MQERLDYLLAIEEEQNMTRAAKRLFISQPALTAYVNKLEQKYGVQFFDRSKTPITVTEAGRLFLREKLRIQAAEENLRITLDQLAGQRLVLRVAANAQHIVSTLPPAICRFRELHPGVNFHLTSCGNHAVQELFHAGGADLFIGVFPVDESAYVWRHLRTEKLRLIVPLSFGVFPKGFDPAGSLEHPCLLQPEQLRDLEYIAPDDTIGAFDAHQLLMQRYSIGSNRPIVAGNFGAIMQLARLQLGYSYGPVHDSLQAMQDESGRFVIGYGILQQLPASRDTGVIFARSHPQAELLQELTELILAQGKPAPRGEEFA